MPPEDGELSSSTREKIKERNILALVIGGSEGRVNSAR